WPRSEPRTSLSSRTAPGITAKKNASTAPCRSSGHTAKSSLPTPTEPPPLPPGSRLTTLNDVTPHSAASRRSAGCHQPDGRVHLEVPGRVDPEVHPGQSARPHGQAVGDLQVGPAGRGVRLREHHRGAGVTVFADRLLQRDLPEERDGSAHRAGEVLRDLLAAP